MSEGLSAHEEMPVVDPLRGNVQDLVITDIEERKRVGIERYGTPLQTFNGRDAVIDLYQELLDATMYVRQHIEERKRGTATVLLMRLRVRVEALYENYIGPEGRGAARMVKAEVLKIIDGMLENVEQ